MSSDNIDIPSNSPTDVINATPTVQITSDDDEKLLKYNEDLDLLTSKLMQSMEHQSGLELKISQLVRENKSLKLENQALRDEVKQTNIELDDLSLEMENLSATLFEEATNKVRDANIANEEAKLQVKRVTKELADKDDLILLLTTEIRNLKLSLSTNDKSYTNMTESADNISEINTPTNETTDSNINLTDQEQHQSIPLPQPQQEDPFQQYNFQTIYSPIYNNLRLDITIFEEYKKLIKSLLLSANAQQQLSSQPPPLSSYSLTQLAIIKDSRFYKTLTTEDIDLTLKLGSNSNLGGIFKTKKSLLNHLFEGKCVIEPLSGRTESWKKSNQLGNQSRSNSINTDSLNSNLYSYPSDSPPIASQESCSFCGESRNDKIEHARLYKLRITNEENTIYYLCNPCLLKTRETCNLFANLRNLIMLLNNYLQQHYNNNNTTHRNHQSIDQLILKSYYEITMTRCKMFWTRVGIFDFYDMNHEFEVKNLPNLNSMTSELNFQEFIDTITNNNNTTTTTTTTTIKTDEDGSSTISTSSSKNWYNFNLSHSRSRKEKSTASLENTTKDESSSTIDITNLDINKQETVINKEQAVTEPSNSLEEGSIKVEVVEPEPNSEGTQTTMEVVNAVDVTLKDEKKVVDEELKPVTDSNEVKEEAPEGELKEEPKEEPQKQVAEDATEEQKEAPKEEVKESNPESDEKGSESDNSFYDVDQTD